MAFEPYDPGPGAGEPPRPHGGISPRMVAFGTGQRASMGPRTGPWVAADAAMDELGIRKRNCPRGVATAALRQVAQSMVQRRERAIVSGLMAGETNGAGGQGAVVEGRSQE